MQATPTNSRGTPPFPSLLDPPERDLDPTTGELHPALRGLTRPEQDATPRTVLDHYDDVTHRVPLSCKFRHSGWQGNRARIYEAFHRTGQPFSRKSQFCYCGSHAYILESVDTPGLYRIAGSSCHDRFCLPCAKERSSSIALNVLEHLAERRARFLTLTIRSNQESLQTLLDKLHTSFNALRQTRLWKQCVTGGVAFLEINYYPTTRRWHPHFHILIEGKYLPNKQLSNLWYSITGDSYIVDIRRVETNVHATRYVTKYAGKPFNQTFITRPNQLDEAILALKGRKLCLTFGTWRGVALLRKPTQGAWRHVDTLQRFIERAASGDLHCRKVLKSLTDCHLDSLYARAPPLPPTGPDRTIPDPQATWLGVWNENGTWSYPLSVPNSTS